MFNAILFVGTTLDEPLYYVNLTRILARMGLYFYVTFTDSLRARQVFGAVSGEKFSVDIDNSVDSTLDQFYFIYFFSLINKFIFLCVSYFSFFHLCCELVSTS